MGISPLTFTGLSKFSDDFQAIVNRTVAIASMPVQRLQSDQTNLISRKAAMGSLRSSVSSLDSALSSLGGLADGRAASANSSSTKVGATMTGTAALGSYVISDVTSLASVASSTSVTGLDTRDATPVAGGGHLLSLDIAGVASQIQLTEATDTLDCVAEAINSGDYGVRAAIIDTGAATGRYHLVLTASSAGPKAISLRDDMSAELMGVTSQGSIAVFKVNGQIVTSSNNSVSGVIEGLVLNLNETTEAGETIDIEVVPGRESIAAALESTVSAYNKLRDAIDAQSGESAGALAGERMMYEIQARMRAVVGASGPDGASSLVNAGITLGVDGKMTFDPDVIASLTDGELDEVFSLLGTSEGALGELAGQFSELSDPVTGLMSYELTSYDATDRRLAEQIEVLSARVNSTQSTLFAQLQAADALLAQLESQQTILEASVESLNLVLFGKKSE